MLSGILNNYVQKMKPHHFLTPYTRTNSKSIKDLSVKLETIWILEEIIEDKIFDISCSNIFSNICPQARETKIKNKQMRHIKLKSVCTEKETINKIKRQPSKEEDIFSNDTSDKRLISKIYKELIKLTNNPHTPHNPYPPQTIQLKNGQRIWIDTSPKWTYRWPIDTWKDAQCH